MLLGLIILCSLGVIMNLFFVNLLFKTRVQDLKEIVNQKKEINALNNTLTKVLKAVNDINEPLNCLIEYNNDICDGKPRTRYPIELGNSKKV